MKILKNKFFITILSIVAFALLVPHLMPKSIDMNLTKVGVGKPSVVFVYDLNLSVSNPQTIEINKAREILDGKVHFLIAKVGDPNGDGFAKGYGAQSADLLFFDSQGRLLHKQMALMSADQIISTLGY